MRRLALLLLVTLVACDDRARRPPPAAESPAPTPAPTVAIDAAQPADAEPAALEAPAAISHRPGPAYLGVDGVGLMKLDGGTLTRVVEHDYKFSRIVADAHGVVYAAAIGGLWRVEGGKPRRLEDPTSMPIEAMALGPDGVLWATDHQQVHRWDGAWTHEPASTFDNALINSVAVDLDGRVWVVTSAALWRLDGDRWNRLDTSFAHTKEPYFEAIAVGVDGTVYVSSLPGLFRFRDDRWTAVRTRDTSIDELVTGTAGHVIASGSVGDVIILAPGRPAHKLDLADGPAKARRGDAAAVDGAGRIWLTTDNGLVILDDQAALVQQWLPGTVSGVTGAITAVAVIGDGPELPALRAAATGTITGTVLRAGKRVAGAAVQLCDMPLTVFQRTPCDGSTFSRTATTGADGGFVLDGVPIGSYGFAVKPGKTWLILIGSNCCTALEEGGSYDVGAITVD